ncbi:LysM peptidoglycan-binding domain-containing protein [Marinomonas sp. 15G1-11]|uniref:LysM peptidoglycan-binding domain-containing protein n=1 Tax=Marinomonas phaeophyticola TaxID=3004091 RepID=A0ABT4JWP1_9GAMM|nr:LysM peptidoglycan-binding domain-containing protein [Marinomonas sp. 15G1-11]MCZ2722785.1 LysM peptidoglycan-binding domain-containing protein [Marinomonas sp. 15G1-11]
MLNNALVLLITSFLLTGCQTLAQSQKNVDNTGLEIQQEANELDDIDISQAESEDDKLIDLVVAQKIESAPDTHPESVIDNDLWNRIRSGYALNLDYDKPRLLSQIKWYSSHKSYLDRVSKRGQRYLFHIVDRLEQAELPLEIAFLPIVESGFDPFGYSHGRASGPWQFIPSTGLAYGLTQDWWYDGRRDIIGSTDAAIAYLTRLNRMFDGNWLHALAAYNSGEGTVLRAIKKNKKAGKPTDFWSLDLPKETRAYVPKLLALAKIFKNPKQYQYQPYFIENKPYFEVVNIGSQIDLAEAANMADTSIDEIYLLNPGFNQWATSPDGPHRLLIPVEKAQKFRAKLVSIPENQRVTWVRYTVDAGDNLLLIAKKHNTTVEVLQDVNKMSSTLIRVGQQLMIPVAGSKIERYTLSSHQRLIRKQSSSSSQKRLKTNYTVKSGDTLWGIAKKYKTDSKSLASWNNMGLNDSLRPGKKLTIWHKATNKSNSARASIVKRIVYSLRAGDSLGKVAQKFNVSVANIKKWNPKVGSKKYVQPGDQVTLLVNVVSG